MVKRYSNHTLPKAGGLVASEHLEEGSDGELEAVDRTELVSVQNGKSDDDEDSKNKDDDEED